MKHAIPLALLMVGVCAVLAILLMAAQRFLEMAKAVGQ